MPHAKKTDDLRVVRFFHMQEPDSGHDESSSGLHESEVKKCRTKSVAMQSRFQVFPWI